jgi:hypothetical protein
VWPSGRVPSVRTSGFLGLMGQCQAPAASSKANGVAVGIRLCGGEPSL